MIARRLLIAADVFIALVRAELVLHRARRAEPARLRARVAELEQRLAEALATIEREVAGVDVDDELTAEDATLVREWHRSLKARAEGRAWWATEAQCASVLGKLLRRAGVA